MQFINNAPDKTIDKYSFNFKSFLGKGSFSEVFLGKDDTNGDIVAIKVINQFFIEFIHNFHTA